jgi:acyl-CoA thioester hydrolase
VIDAFQLLLRVRYSECDAQGIVFNARWSEYVDVAAGELCRALFGAIDPTQTGTDWKLVKQTLEWKASGRYDDVLDIRVRCVRVGTTSFTLATEFRRHPDDAVIVTAETVYVLIHPALGTKRRVPDQQRIAFERGAPGVTVNQAGI